MKDVKIYSTPTCPYCQMAKEYLSSKRVPYEEFDVSVDQTALARMIKLTGQMGVPVIIIDGKPVLGFDKKQLDALLV